MEIKILAIEASTRENSATNLKLDRHLSTFKNAEIKKFRLSELNLPLFIDDREKRNWATSDHLETLLEEMTKADLIILASPLYWYSVSHLMKNFLDHWTYYLRHPKYPLKEIIKGKHFELIVVGHGEESNLTQAVFQTLKQSVEYIGAITRAAHYFTEHSVRDEL